MKKLSLKNLNIEANNMLHRSELKSVYGGYGGSGEPNSCTADCPDGESVTCTGWACLATDNVGCSYLSYLGQKTPHTKKC